MFQGRETPKLLIKLAGRPLLQDLQKYADQVLKTPSKGFNLVWNKADNSCGFALIIGCEGYAKDPHFRMSSQTGPVKKELWFYVSSDINKIFAMMIASIGEDLQKCYAADIAQGGATALPRGMADMVPAPPPEPAAPGPGLMAVPPPAQQGAPMISPVYREPAHQRTPAAVSIASPSELLTGNLALLHVTNLLQSIAMGKMTGRLHIDPDGGPVEIFFEMGMPVHALSRKSSGEECFLEVVALNNGAFVFEPNLKTDIRTITHALDSLILKGVQLIDCLGVIEKSGVTTESVVHRAHQGLSEAEFELRVREGAPLDMTLQKRFYITINESLTVRQIAESLKLLRSEWVPIVSNLIRVGLATFTSSATVLVHQPAVVILKRNSSVTVEKKRIDPVMLEQFAHHMKKPDTGAFTYPAFLYFLEQEFLRYTHHQAPFAIILLDLRLNKVGNTPAASLPAPRPGMMMGSQAISPQAVAHMVRCMLPAKRELDLIAHYEGQSMAVLMPNTDPREAMDVAQRVSAVIGEARVTVGLEKLSVAAVLGVACLPQDVDIPGELLAAAELAKERANNEPDGIKLFSELT